MLKFKVLKSFSAKQDYKEGVTGEYHKASVKAWAALGFVEIIKSTQASQKKVIEGPEIKK